MTLTLAAILSLAAHCAPSVAPQTLLAIVEVESARNPYAIGVNGDPREVTVATGGRDAVARAAALIGQGRSVDLGLGQINSANLARLGLTLEQVFDPCLNLAAAARILQEGYGRSRSDGADAKAALRTALSLYNTGHPSRGLANGYAAKVARAAARLARSHGPAVTPPRAAPPAWDVFGQVPARPSFFIPISTPASGDAS